MWSNIVFYSSLAFQSLIGVFGLRLYEEPRYDVIARLDDRVEIRRYAPRLAAEVEAAGGQAKTDEAFRLLFAYIAGANQAAEGGAKIAMTVPVEVRRSEKVAMTVPVQVSPSGETMRMLFYLPAELTAATAPKPADPRVRIITVPGETIATLRFSGSPDAAPARQADLLDSLKPSRWRSAGVPYMLSYDPPFTLPFLRRNEAAVVVASGP